MATVNKFVNGKKIDAYIATMTGVQDALQKYAFEILAYADVRLQEFSPRPSGSAQNPIEGHSFVEIQKDGSGANKGWVVVLNDMLGDQAAYNIEKGRKTEFFDPVTGLPMGGMDGLFILDEAVKAVAALHRGELL